MDREELIEHAAHLILNRSGRLPKTVTRIAPNLARTADWVEIIEILGRLATKIIIIIITVLEKRQGGGYQE